MFLFFFTLNWNGTLEAYLTHPHLIQKSIFHREKRKEIDKSIYQSGTSDLEIYLVAKFCTNSLTQKVFFSR